MIAALTFCRAGSEVVGGVSIKNREREELAPATRPTLSPLQTSSNLQETERKLLHQLFVQTAGLNVACAAVLGDYGRVLMPFELQTQDRSSVAAHISFANEGVRAQYLDRATGLEPSVTLAAPQVKWRKEHNQILSIVEWALYAAKKHFEEPPPFARSFRTEELLEVRPLLPPDGHKALRTEGKAAAEAADAGRTRKRARSSSPTLADPGSRPPSGVPTSGLGDSTTIASGSLVARDDDMVPWQGLHDPQRGLFLYITLCPHWQSDFARVYRAWHSPHLSAPVAELPQPYLRTAPPPDATACVIKTVREIDEDEGELWTNADAAKLARCERAAYAALQPLQGAALPRLLYCGPLELRLDGRVPVLVLEHAGTALSTLTPAAVAAAGVRDAVVAVRAAVAAAFSQLHRHGWCHNDATLCNMLFDVRSGRACIIDLESAAPCCNGAAECVVAAREMEEVHAELDLWEAEARD
jgi:hypothetical protein